jgi:hypothetical protein
MKGTVYLKRFCVSNKSHGEGIKDFLVLYKTDYGDEIQRTHQLQKTLSPMYMKAPIAMTTNPRTTISRTGSNPLLPAKKKKSWN